MMLVHIMSELDFQTNLCEAFCLRQKAALLWKLSFGMRSVEKTVFNY